MEPRENITDALAISRCITMVMSIFLRQKHGKCGWRGVREKKTTLAFHVEREDVIFL